ncbi:hypothetical protein POVWA2_041290 [Plasmodium ovale wallikeri]|uniref:Uncharacterized protein n=1 Tax=Plasmodium ovale wallikeri TaxID=864142 RepID=A0A1A8ZB44_PLAOA|nr:hypothetical protein POVWA2_041290 [Plasmodium ovale wallikeri]SBT58470.1 hypothetical protein POVWA1_087880 [Plasmodium ovale wallikeri]
MLLSEFRYPYVVVRIPSPLRCCPNTVTFTSLPKYGHIYVVAQIRSHLRRCPNTVTLTSLPEYGRIYVSPCLFRL